MSKNFRKIFDDADCEELDIVLDKLQVDELDKDTLKSIKRKAFSKMKIEKKSERKSSLFRIVAVAACVCFAITVVVTLPMMKGKDESHADNNLEEESLTDKNWISTPSPNENDILFLSALTKHVESDKVSEELLKLFKNADTVRSVPLLGTYLEETNIRVYMFFNEGEICSTALLSFDTKGDPVDIELTEFAQTDTSEYLYIDAHSNESCYSAVKNCMEIDPNFEIIGIVFSTSGYHFTFPIGRCKGENVIKYFFNEPMLFNLVEPFESIEQGRDAFSEYLSEKEAIKAQLPIFLWNDVQFYESGFWNSYSLEYMYNDTKENQDQISPIVQYIDSCIAIPLLDENFSEGVLVSHLLYYRNELIGEVVICWKADAGTAVAVYCDISQKREDGTYVKMDKSEYQKVIERARELYPYIEIAGVIFKEDSYIPFGYEEGQIVYMK
ncbi:MAG: hypothetical protein E7611_01225 [Ruminococcaceae bacterium]|nr:hypothetical protein [Oscillospiraceae bacterium]